MNNLTPQDWNLIKEFRFASFSSAHEAKMTLMDYTIENGFALVIERSSERILTMACSQGGEKRSHKAGGWQPNEGQRTQRAKKAGCSFVIKLRKHEDEDPPWRIFTTNESHSGHSQLAAYEISVLPAARSHFKEKHGVVAAIEERCASRVESSVIWSTL